MTQPAPTLTDPRGLAAHLISGQLALARDEDTHPTDHWSLLTLPGPAQTRAYAQAVLARESDDLLLHEAQALVDDRMNRGRALRESTAPRRFCVAELALTSPVLAAEGLHAQHAHLADLDQLAHVQIRVLPHGADELLCHDFQLRNGQALLESPVGLVDLPDAEGVFRPRFDRLWNASIPYRAWYRQLPR
jgi:hypothetical protein